MIIRHYCNSFIEVQSSNEKIVCDPWIGKTKESAWYSWPLYKENTSFLNKINPDFIYISHLHCDHFDEKVLSRYRKKNTRIIIKKFNSKRLKKKINDLGFNNVLEIDALKRKKISEEFNIAIVPQMSTNTSELEDHVNYDLDTSIIIQSRSDKKVFYNNVDNPLSINELKSVKKFIDDKFRSALSIICYPLGAASGYPQAFTNLNKPSEKRRIIKKSFKKLDKVVKIFNPEFYFPAGGTYMITGKFSLLNKWIAQPCNIEVAKHFRSKSCKFINIEGGGYINLNGNKSQITTIIDDLGSIKNHIQKKLSKVRYFYQKKRYIKSINFMNKLFNESQDKYFQRIKTLNIYTNWNIKINVYKDLCLKNDGEINMNKSGYFKSFIIKSNSKYNSKKVDLECNLDKDLFCHLMMRNSPWNTALTGSIIIFSRKSKIYNPTVENSLNFFTV